jgi:hypothetical protein
LLDPNDPVGTRTAEDDLVATARMDDFLLIIGAMKSGTTSLFEYLAGHPEIARSRIKEPHFFAYEDKWSRGWSWYESLWDWDPARHKYAMEASTSYTKLPIFPNAAERIAATSARFKFIYIMRNPIERIESQLNHMRAYARAPRVQVVPLNPMRVHLNAIAVSKYASQLDEYYKRFPAKDIKLLFFEDVKLKPIEVMTEVCAFLDLEACFDREHTGVAYHQSKDKTYIANPVIRYLRSSRAGRMLSKVLPADVRTKVKAKVLRPPDLVRLSPQQKEKYLAALMPDLQRLQGDYGVDVSRWGINL